MAVLGLVSTLLITQMAHLISGIPGSNFVFTIVLAIQTGFSLLIYEGKRWRFFAQLVLFTLLIIPTFLGGAPFDVITRSNFFVSSFLCDIGFNSIYSNFKKRNKLLEWAVLGTLTFWLLMPFIGVCVNYLFYKPEIASNFFWLIIMLLPVIIVESVVGGYLGYKIYTRTRLGKTIS